MLVGVLDDFWYVPKKQRFMPLTDHESWEMPSQEKRGGKKDDGKDNSTAWSFQTEAIL